jgi:hypothetical protein
MAQNPFDQLAKQYLEDILTPIGQVTCNLEIPGESKFVDVFFNPTQPPPADLGLLGRIIQTPCSLEPFRNAPSRQEIRTCWMKLLWLQENARRKAKRHIPDPHQPQLWILAAKTSQPVLRETGAQPHPDWPMGVYFMASLTKTAIIALDQLPPTPDTLWLRLLGRGPTQETAIREILDLPSRHPRRMPILRLLASWKVRIELTEIPNLKARDEFMAFTQAFLEWEQKTEERGWIQGHQIGQEEGKEKGKEEERRSLLTLLLSQRFAPLPDSIIETIQTLGLDQLEALAIALFTLADPTALKAWLTQALATQLIAQFTNRLGPIPPPLAQQFQTASLSCLLQVAQADSIVDFESLTTRLNQA